MALVNGINHLGLVVEDMAKARWFFTEVLDLQVLEDRGDLLFLTAGSDVLALKTPQMAVRKPEHGGESAHTRRAGDGWEALDHYGFFAESPDAVDAMADRLRACGIVLLKGPYDRSDGRSVYFRDPCGNVGEYFYFQPKH